MSFVAQAVDETFELPAIGCDPLLKISEPAAATGRRSRSRRAARDQRSGTV